MPGKTTVPGELTQVTKLLSGQTGLWLNLPELLLAHRGMRMMEHPSQLLERGILMGERKVQAQKKVEPGSI